MTILCPRPESHRPLSGARGALLGARQTGAELLPWLREQQKCYPQYRYKLIADVLEQLLTPLQSLKAGR